MARNAPAVRYSTAQMDAALATFRQQYPAFEDTRLLDDLRATDYARLDNEGQLYLDYTGGGLYAERQIRAHLDMLSQRVFGNPHSDNPTSSAMTELVEHARAFILEYFNADPDEYAAIFTLNASGALKLVGESYPFAAGGRYLLTFDNHNSVNGIREFARAKGAEITYVPMQPPDLRVSNDLIAAHLDQMGSGPCLFSYPAQSNFTGVQHPLEWMEWAHARGWDVLVDGAAFVPTNRLDLSRWHPDFVPLSFYKMFGYPTGVGCLLARRAALAKLQRPWFAGGTIWAVTVQGDRHYMAEGEAAFEDGTLSYLSLPAVEIGLKHLLSIGVETIHTRVMTLTGWLLDNLLALRHDTGTPVACVYGPRDCQMRGGTIALNFLDPQGKVIDERVVSRRANMHTISLRTGCFCNPGAGEAAFSISKESMAGLFVGEETMTYEQFLTALGLPSGGAVRVSLGLATTFADVYRFMEFAQTFLNDVPDEGGLPARQHC
ncbi:MAG TPA: aminotransferase class V-fold PLP-dependent enzyme [Ktedonobacterales bacterium]|nr:aminotransferase class V-fold PLP-dependent enzyme [Ktedonobacterales bacterium]